MRRLRHGFLFVSAVALLVLWSVVILGAGGRSQFCPSPLEHRGVTVYTVPFTDIELWTSAHEPERRRIVQFWYDEGYARADGPPGEWHEITVWTSWMRFSGSGPAKVFWYFAGCQDGEGAEGWIAWSQRCPALAADLWPRVVHLLRQAGAGSEAAESYWEAQLLMVLVKGAKAEPDYHERLADWQRRCAEARSR